MRSAATTAETRIAPRSIDNFEGKGVIIGCSHNHISCKTKHLHKPEAFYTIDFNGEHKPDFEFDITKQLPLKFNDRFQLTVLECLDCYAYNLVDFAKRYGSGEKGFKNVLAMTAADGFILIIGSHREKEYRKSYHHLNYIEFNNGNIVLIPKNQQLSIQQICTQIQNLDEALQKTIYDITNLRDIPVDSLSFCKIRFEDMPTISENWRERIRGRKPQANDSSTAWNKFLSIGVPVAILVGIGFFAKRYYSNPPGPELLPQIDFHQ